MQTENYLEVYWQQIPIGKENAISYEALCASWGMNQRMVRKTLHDLSAYDNGDSYILIRSSKSKGFYRTDDEAEIRMYRKECINKGRSIFAPVKKCDRVLSIDDAQLVMDIIGLDCVETNQYS
jgi:hypothetical protein